MGSGLCIVYAPGTFAHDAESKAIVLDPGTDSLDAVQAAIEACPTGAITVAPDDQGV
jgi:ferredoxin